MMEMSRSLRVLVVVILVLHLANQAYSFNSKKPKRPLNCYWEPKKCVKVYQFINNHLEKHVQTEDVATNMLIISDWITELSEKNSDYKADVNILSALIQINYLAQLDDGTELCVQSSAKILQNNDEALAGVLAKREPGSPVPKMRLARILKHYLDKFLDNCDYKPVLKNNTRKLSVQKLEGLKSYLSDLIGLYAKNEVNAFNPFAPKIEDHKSYVRDNPIAASAFAAKSMKSLGQKQQDAMMTNRFLLSSMKRDGTTPSGPMSDELKGVRPYIKKYITEPCQEYTQLLQSLFSNKWTLAQAVKYHQRVDETEELYKHLAYFHGCNKVLLNMRQISQGVADLHALVAPLHSESENYEKNQFI